MNTIKKHIVLLFISVGTCYAGSPGGTSGITKEKAGEVKYAGSIFTTFAAKRSGRISIFMPASQLNAQYITGCTRKKESAIGKLLRWDCKVKFRLNRNMNIIFTYN